MKWAFFVVCLWIPWFLWFLCDIWRLHPGRLEAPFTPFGGSIRMVWSHHSKSIQIQMYTLVFINFSRVPRVRGTRGLLRNHLYYLYLYRLYGHPSPLSRTGFHMPEEFSCKDNKKNREMQGNRYFFSLQSEKSIAFMVPWHISHMWVTYWNLFVYWHFKEY